MIDTTGGPTIVPKLSADSGLSLDDVPFTFTRTGSATRVNSSGQIENVAPNIPRYSYDANTLAFKGVLFEEARTNVLPYSDIDNDGSPSSWTAANAGYATVSATAPDGTSTCAQITTSATDGRLSYQYLFTAAGTWAFSAFFQAGTLSAVKCLVGNFCSADANLSTGTVVLSDISPTQGIAATIEQFPLSWYRVTIVFRVFGPSMIAMKLQNNSGTAVGTFKVWGAQLEDCGSGEQNSTSYIPTVAVAVSRGADLMSAPIGTALGASISDTWFDQNGPGSLYAEFIKDKREQTSSNLLRAVVNTYWGLGPRGIELGHYSPSGSPAIPHAGVIQTNSLTTTLVDNAAYVDAATDKLAASWDTGTSGSINLSVNGAAALTGTNRGSNGTTMYFGGTGSAASGAKALNGYVRRVAYFDSTLSTTDLATLTGGGSISAEPIIDFDFTETDIEDQIGSLDNPVFFYDDIARTATITGSSAAAGYPADAAQRPDTYEKWSGTSMPMTWAAARSSAQLVNFMLIAAHNLGTSECTVKAQYSGDGGTYTDASDVFTPTAGDDSVIVLLFSPQIAANWRAYVAASGSPGAIPKIGVIKFGQALVMPYPIYGGFGPPVLSRQTEIIPALSRGGNFLGQDIKRGGLVASPSFRNLRPDWYRSNFDPFVEDARKYPFGFAWRPNGYPEDIVYAWSTTDIRPTNMGTGQGLMQVQVPMVAYDSVA